MPAPYSGQKRRRDDYDDGNRRPARMSTHRQILVRLRREIVEIGEPSRFKVSQMIHHLGEGLGSIDTDEMRNGVMDTISAVVKEQPHKIPLLAGALEIANYNPSSIMGQAIVEMVHTKIEEYLSNGQWTYVKLYVRFLVTLSPIIEGDGVTLLLTQLMKRAVEMQNKDDKRNGAAEELYVGVLLALPFFAYPAPRELDDIFEISRDFEFKSTPDQIRAVSPFISTKNDSESWPYQPQEFVKLVRASIEKIGQDGWRVNSLIDVSSAVKSYRRRPENLENVKRHTFPQVNIPEELSNEPTQFYKYPRLYLQTYLPSKFETVPPPDTFEAVITRDVATDIINGMDFNRKEVARQLITLDLFFSPPTFAAPGISFDRLEKLEPGQSTWKVEDVALEAVLDHMFRLPYTHHKSVYYNSILIEACIMAPQAIAPVFGRAIRFMYSNLKVLDTELIQAFLGWFAHHLSNFGFTWKWQEWAGDVSLPDLHPKRVFIKELILKEVRLCYTDRIRETLTPEFAPFLPKISDEVQFKYLEGEGMYQETVNRLITHLREAAAAKKKSLMPTGQKQKDENDVKMDQGRDEDANENETKEAKEEEEEEKEKEVDSELDSIVNELRDKATSEAVGGRADAIDKTLVDIVVSTVCYLGSRSLSHAENWVDRCSPLINSKIIGNDEIEERQKDVINSVLTFWSEQPHVGLIVLKFFVKSKVVPAQVLLDSILQDNSLLFSNHGWGSICNILDHNDELVGYILSDLQTKVGNLPEAADGSNGEQESGNGEETSAEQQEANEKQWLRWWYEGLIRTISRRYHDKLGDYEGESGSIVMAKSLCV